MHSYTRISTLLFLSLAAVLHADDAAAPAIDTLRLEDLEVTAPRHSALTQAPTESRLDATQPLSVINLDYISNQVAPTADFATIANIAPSVANVETNGPGLSESKHLTMRGFDDAQYNVTFDGIPFGDQNDYSHHTTSYFPAKLIGRMVVDRGPGSASTIGQASFGGTIAMYSKDPRTVAGFVPTLSYGSWNTQLGHFEVNSGLLPALNNASVIASYQRMSTDGYRTFSDMKRDTTYVKYLQPIGHDASLTFLSSYNKIHFSNPGKLTQQQIDTLGRNFGLNGDPTSTLYRGYNYQDKQADFEYLGFDARLGNGWEAGDKVYTYYYNNESREKPKTKTVSAVVNMLGSFKVNRYRAYGNYFLLSHQDSVGTFKTGVWLEYSRNPRYLYGLDYTTTGGDAVDLSTATVQFKPVSTNPLTAVGQPDYNYSYDMVAFAKTLQPFAEYEWQASSRLLVDGGVKYYDYTRDIEAPVNGTKSRNALYFQHTVTKALPSLTANYRLRDNWSAYAQAAQGILAPNLNQFYVENPSANTVKPAETWNYQFGTVYRHDHFNASADVYLIDFKNYAYTGPKNSSGDPAYYGVAAGAYYSGAEAEATYYLGNGLSAYGNLSINNAKFKGSKLNVPTVPDSTAAFGLVYNSKDGFFGSFTEKYVGKWWVYDNLTNPDVAGGGVTRMVRSDTYWLGDLSIGYSHRVGQGFFRSYKVRLQISNLFDQKVQVLEDVDASAANAYAADDFNVLPERNYFLTLSGEF
ncbi:MAG TPA: TonB-dependent receptor [Lacunisphaera sp.]|nr:TonB-dependent receptor [Lacunisphaera sp.]